MKIVKLRELLSHTDKLYRLTGNSSRGERRAASCITVKFCKYHTVDAERIVKCTCHRYGVLTGHSVNNKKNLVGMNLGLNVFKLVHQRFIYMKTPCRIYENVVISLILGKGNCVLRYFNRVALTLFEHGDSGLLADYLQLLYGSRAVHVTRNKQRSVTLVFKLQCYFGTMSCFTGALKAAHHNDCGSV